MKRWKDFGGNITFSVGMRDEKQDQFLESSMVWDREVETQIPEYLYYFVPKEYNSTTNPYATRGGRLLLMRLSGNNITDTRINRTDND